MSRVGQRSLKIDGFILGSSDVERRRGEGVHYFPSSSNAAPKYPCYFCSQDFQKKRFILSASNHSNKEKQVFGRNKLNRKTLLQKA